MAKAFRLSPLVFAVVVLAALLAYLNWPKEAIETAQRQDSTPVVLQSVNKTEFPVVVEALGTARANEAVFLTAKKAEIVQSIEFDDGDFVEKGQLLLTLNNREERARVNELEVNLQEAKRQLKRITNLARESVASQQLLDEQEARVKALGAQLEVVRSQLSELEVRAPFSGRLGIRQVSLGALVSPGDVITTLDDVRQVKVDFSIAEVHLPTVELGQPIISTSVAYEDEPFSGKITSIDSRVDPVTRAIKVRAIVDNPEYKLRPGMLLQINLQKQILDTLVVPEKSLVPIEDKQYVFVVVNGVAKQREVSVGLRKPGIAQILDGLSEGEQVVVEGSLRLRDGSPVSVLQAGL